MRINKYVTQLNDDGQTVLMKECSTNYPNRDKLSSPEDVVWVMQDVFSLNRCAEEYIYMIGLNSACRPIAFFEISHGTVNTSLMQPREVLIRALLCGAVSIIICHNHPSRCPVPSENDIRLTERLREACDLVGIILHDHIIIGSNNYTSFREAKLL